MALNNAVDWIWYQGTDGSDLVKPGEEFLRSRLYIGAFLMHLEANAVPFERAYCPITYTINIVFPRSYNTDIGVQSMFKDGGYKEKPMPTGIDLETSKDLHNAILGGSDMNKNWH